MMKISVHESIDTSPPRDYNTNERTKIKTEMR